MIDDSFLDNDSEVAEVVETEEVVETDKVEAAEEVEAKEPEKEEKVETEESTTDSEPKEKEPWTLTAVLDEREKRQKAVEEANELRKRLEAFEKSDDDISLFDDETGAKAQLEQRFRAELHNSTLGLSKAYAERELGKEVVAKAAEWYANEGMKSAYIVDRIDKADLKFHEVVDAYNEDMERQNPELLRAKLKAEILAELEAAQPEKKSVTKSLASSRSVTGEQTVMESFEDLLGN